MKPTLHPRFYGGYMDRKRKRMKYLIAFLIMLTIEVLIAIFAHDGFVRPYLGDVFVVILIYFFVRIFFPDGIRLLPLYIFLFATTVEVLQYFDFVDMIGFGENRFAQIILGTTFSFADIVCYAVGCILCGLIPFVRKR